MKNSYAWNFHAEVAFFYKADQAGHESQQDHGWKQDAEGIRFMKLKDEGEPLFRIISDHLTKLFKS